MYGDCTILGEGTINHFWTLCFADEVLRGNLGLKYISQMRDEHPYWYLWFIEPVGVFKLEMLQCMNEADWDWRALFHVKYYPRPQEVYFQGLSVLEQLCRMSDLFNVQPAHWAGGETGCACHGGVQHQAHESRFVDLAVETGAPALKCSEKIPEDFFLAGQMELCHSAGRVSSVSWESLSSWRVLMTENYYMSDEDGNTLKVLRKGDLDRNYPGWSITDSVVSRFANAWLKIHGYGCIVESSLEEAGVEFVSDGRRIQQFQSSAVKRVKKQLLMTNEQKEV